MAIVSKHEAHKSDKILYEVMWMVRKLILSGYDSLTSYLCAYIFCPYLLLANNGNVKLYTVPTVCKQFKTLGLNLNLIRWKLALQAYVSNGMFQSNYAFKQQLRSAIFTHNSRLVSPAPGNSCPRSPEVSTSRNPTNVLSESIFGSLISTCALWFTMILGVRVHARTSRPPPGSIKELYTDVSCHSWKGLAVASSSSDPRCS